MPSLTGLVEIEITQHCELSSVLAMNMPWYCTESFNIKKSLSVRLRNLYFVGNGDNTRQLRMIYMVSHAWNHTSLITFPN